MSRWFLKSIMILSLAFSVGNAQRDEIGYAFLLETAVPGAGLVYAGEYEEAAFSLGMSASLAFMVQHDRSQGLSGNAWLAALVTFRFLEILNATQRIVCTPDGRIRVEFAL